MNILGISAFYHDSAACLLQDGRLVAAAQEERFTRVRHDARFPKQAIDFCLEYGGIHAGQLDYVAYYDKPLVKFERLLETYLAYAPVGFASFVASIPSWVRQKLHLPREMDRQLGGGSDRAYRGPYVFTDHHESHAASAFFPSPFDQAAILTLDGVGEWATATFGTGRGHQIELTHEWRYPHSLGLLYSAFTYFAGFRVNSGEYKLMGLAPYGEPTYRDLILDHLIDLNEDGSFRMDMSYFNYCQGVTMTGPKMDRLFGGPPRQPESAISKREMDLAASVQAVTDEVMLRTARHVRRQTGMKNLVMAGGVALNGVGNGKILREGIFENLWVQPASGDAGGALGAAMFVWHQLLDNPRQHDGIQDMQRGSLLGPRYTNDQVRAFLDEVGATYHHHKDEDTLLGVVADRIADGQVVGYMQGPMEFGPRALGARSILGDARSPKMQSLINRKIKFRESFRPFAPSVLQEDAHRWFDMKPGQSSPYMLLVLPVHQDQWVMRDDPQPTPSGLELLKQPRSTIPAVTHVDRSARVQTVDPDRHGRFYRLLECFKQKTGCPVLINTSFNIRGEPIVCSPEHAYRCFIATGMDVLVIEDYLLLKSEQPHAEKHDVDAYLTEFELD